MKFQLSIFLTLLFLTTSFAQNRNPAQDINRANVWKFGTFSTLGANDGPRLDFSNGTPVLINEGNNRVAEGASSISSLNGDFQLCGGKLKMFNRLHSPMANAPGEVGDSGWAGISQANIAIPLPGNPDIIYYFSASVTLKYNVVDMTANAGLGAVTKRNVDLHPYPVAANLAAVHHCNGSDVWIMGHEWLNNTFYAYLLTDTGVTTTPVINQIGPVKNEQGTWQSGRIKFSPDGNKMAITFDLFEVEPNVFGFDKSTGILSNPVPLQRDTAENGLSFSPDNTKLYISTNNGKVIQYNMEAGNAADIAASRRLIGKEFTSFSAMQMGRDGKIYIVKSGFPGSDYLGVISNPNALDTFCNFNANGIFLNGAFGLPSSLMNTVESYFYTGSSAYPCFGDTVVTTNASLAVDSGLQSRVFPNPFTDYTIIETRNLLFNHPKIKYLLYDAMGKECTGYFNEYYDDGNTKRTLLYKRQLAQGIYYLSISIDNQIQTLILSIL
jgi:hypothetical protein